MSRNKRKEQAVPAASSGSPVQGPFSRVARRILSIARRSVTPTDMIAIEVPPSVSPYLLPHEWQTIVIRRHPVSLAVPFMVPFVAILGAILINAGALPGNAITLGVVYGGFVLGIGVLSVAMTAWAKAFMVISDRRLIFIRGTVVRKVAAMPLSMIDDVRLARSLSGRLLGYGTLVLELNGPDRPSRKIKYMPYPVQVYMEMSELLFPDDRSDV
jgi:hypothetical protein